MNPVSHMPKEPIILTASDVVAAPLALIRAGLAQILAKEYAESRSEMAPLWGALT